MKSGLLLDVVIRKGPAILKLLAGKDQPLLIWRDSFLVLDLCFDILNGVARLNLQGDGLPREGLDEDLHAASQTKNQMKSGLFLDVIIREGPAIFKLLAGKDQPLLIRRDSFLVLDLCFDILNWITWLNLQGDGLPGEGLDKDLHSASQSQDEMKGRFLLDVVVGQGAPILQLLAGENETLLIRRNAFFVLDLCFNVFDAVGRFDLEGDGLPRKSLHEDLHFETQAMM